MKKYIIFLMALIILSLFGCKSGKQITNTGIKAPAQMVIGPPLVIYKTKADYSSLVPVMLTEDKSQIVSFPHPSDLKSSNVFLTPTKLKNDYLLDNRGINENVAFLKYTYEEYSKLETLPSITKLYDAIIEKDPLIELYRCGLRASYENPEDYFNQLIEKEKLGSECSCVIKNSM